MLLLFTGCSHTVFQTIPLPDLSSYPKWSLEITQVSRPYDDMTKRSTITEGRSLYLEEELTLIRLRPLIKDTPVNEGLGLVFPYENSFTYQGAFEAYILTRFFNLCASNNISHREALNYLEHFNIARFLEEIDKNPDPFLLDEKAILKAIFNRSFSITLLKDKSRSISKSIFEEELLAFIKETVYNLALTKEAQLLYPYESSTLHYIPDKEQKMYVYIEDLIPITYSIKDNKIKLAIYNKPL